jgi:hypothetical protein
MRLTTPSIAHSDPAARSLSPLVTFTLFTNCLRMALDISGFIQ